MQPLGCHTITWRGKLLQALEAIAALGFRRFEAGSLHPWLRGKGELDTHLRRLQLQPVSLYVGGTHVYPKDHELEMVLAEKACELLAGYGCRHIVIGGGQVRPAGPAPDDYAVLAGVLEKMGHLAHSHGLQVCYHPHCGTLVETAGQIDRIAALTDPSLVSFCFDTAHLALAGADPLMVMQRYLERMKYVHLKDLDRNDCFRELGAGEIDLKAIVGFLRSTAFDGPIILELDGSDDPLASARVSRDYALNELGLTLE